MTEWPELRIAGTGIIKAENGMKRNENVTYDQSWDLNYQRWSCNDQKWEQNDPKWEWNDEREWNVLIWVRNDQSSEWDTADLLMD
jgi:hypothetical protein